METILKRKKIKTKTNLKHVLESNKTKMNFVLLCAFGVLWFMNFDPIGIFLATFMVVSLIPNIVTERRFQKLEKKILKEHKEKMIHIKHHFLNEKSLLSKGNIHVKTEKTSQGKKYTEIHYKNQIQFIFKQTFQKVTPELVYIDDFIETMEQKDLKELMKNIQQLIREDE